MASWVEQSPPLANKDYTHINSRGGVRMASLLYAYLMKEYAQAVTTPVARPDSSASSKAE